MNKTVAIVYNTCSYVYISRMNLIADLQGHGYTILLIAPFDEFTYKIKSMGVICHDVVLDNKGINPIKDFKYYRNLKKIYRKWSPDVILHFTIKPNIYGSLVSTRSKIPTLNTITGLGTAFLGHPIVKRVSIILYQFAFKKVDMVFFQNKFDLNIFQNEKILEGVPSLIIPGSGVDTEKFRPRTIKAKENVFKFLFVGRLMRDKGIIEYIQAASKIHESYANVSFQILGGVGVQNKTAISLKEVKEWDQNGIVEYLGETEDVRDLIADSDCVVLPSYREGTSKSLLEAASMSKPIIASDVPGCNNIVTNGKNGFLCRPKDYNHLASKMEEMLNLPFSAREKMGVYGRKKIIEEFEESIVINYYLNQINKLIKK